MPKLPIDDVLAEIKETLGRHDRMVLQAPPGAGKTTAVPIALLGQPWLKDKQIIMLEPRRLAARNAAARMAFLLNEKIGETIGYQIRQDSCFSKRTKILVVTEGILTRRIQADPELNSAALVIFDEFHERSLHADLSLALCLQSQQIIRNDLKLLVMSATLNSGAISALLVDAPLIQSEGRCYPVDIRYTESNITATDRHTLGKALLNTAKHVIHEHRGNCLVFLPGVREINQLADSIKQYLDETSINNILITPLHGNLNKQQQDRAISPPAADHRKIVLATNIAETSLTIEGIDCVIDSGLERILEYDPASAMNRLTTRAISQDSAEQRSGRAGRLSAGTCYRLWSARQQQRLARHSLAEILHSDLSSLVLELANWGVSQADELSWLDIPPSSATDQAKDLLKQLDALDIDGRITMHGRNMLETGTHPRLAHMMLRSAELGQTYHGCLIAALLTEKDFFLAGADRSYDLHDRISILQNSRSSRNIERRGIDPAQCRRIIQSADDFYKRLNRKTLGDTEFNHASEKNVDEQLSGVLLAYAYPDRIARQRSDNDSRYLMSNGKGASIPQHLQQHLYEYLVIANLDAKQRESTIYLAAEITTEQLQDYFIESIQISEEITWNETLQRVEVKRVSHIGKVIIQQETAHDSDREAVKQCLVDAIKKSGLHIFNWSPQANGLVQRVNFINENIKNNADLEKQLGDIRLPDFTDSALLASLSDWLSPQLGDENSFKQCYKLDLYRLLRNMLSWEQLQVIERLAPEKVTVPSGSAISVDYSDPATPVLAVRLQEVFGLRETPTLLAGHCKLMLHLLSPARRPMQVTQDLNSFWKTAYHEVKKELRGKYKKHYWPDDPLTAQATSKTKKQMNR
ncbi:MAG: ATP-dependent helicase HrpB [Gammaproteobacteria bacterium]|nr:ATP-dependent helicase HrpB [Gammaproteobacteria bacterium]NNJ49018.1 ATP-dependent helicase HrpB [Gammaproteobacteria bacterium]